MYYSILALMILVFSGCGSRYDRLPQTLGEKASNYGYIPLDGLPVDQTYDADSCKPWRLSEGEKAKENPWKPLLQSLPDISVRFAVASFNSSGALAFGPSKITTAGKNYRAILDYVNVDVIPVRLWITAFKNEKPISLFFVNADSSVATFKAQKVKETQNTSSSGNKGVSDDPPYPGHSELVSIPVYVGIGMRMAADITAIEGGIALTSLGSIGIQAQAKTIVGTLTVQTIGISGAPIATSLPLPSSLNQTTIENGIMSIGNNRAVVYRPFSKGGEKDIHTLTVPRIVGLYSPIGSHPALINAIYTELSTHRPEWPRPCKSRKSTKGS